MRFKKNNLVFYLNLVIVALMACNKQADKENIVPEMQDLGKLVEQKDYDAVMRQAKQIYEKDPEKKEYINFYGAMNFSYGDDPSISIKYYNKAIEIDPGYSDPYYNTGIYYYKTHDYSKALVYFEKAMDLKYEKEYYVYYYMGKSYYELKEWTLSCKYFNKFGKAVKSLPNTKEKEKLLEELKNIQKVYRNHKIPPQSNNN